jgi:MtrB/PioB family decaheme-associated outer membrane protein
VQIGPVAASGWLETGGRSISGDHDSSKFEEYRDPQEGIFGAAGLLLQDMEERHYLRLEGFDIGERDADYSLEGGRWGKWGISASLSLLPHAFSENALTPYRGVDGGQLSLPFVPPADAAGFENAVTGALRDANLDFDTLEGSAGAFYKPSSEIEFETGYRIIDREGRRPEQLTYGFSNFVHYPQPVDEQIHEGTADVRLVRDSYTLGFNYTASLFENEFRSIQLENPATFAGGSPLGAVAAAPDNSAHLVSLTGSAALPTSFPARVASTVAYGFRFQDESFVPLTVNPALVPAALPADHLDGDVRTFLANLALTARPSPKVEVTGRYRIYDYGNRSDEILFTQVSTTDATLDAETVQSFASSFTTQDASVETSYRVTDATRATLALNWERWSRAAEREVSRSDEYSPEVRIDHRAGSWGRFRTSYAFRERSGDSYDELAPFWVRDPLNIPASLTPPIRRFDEAENRGHVFHLLSQFFLRDDTDLTVTSDVDLTDWTDGHFGLTTADRYAIGLEASHQPFSRVEISVYYNHDWSNLRLRSASSGGALVWESDHEDRAHTGGMDVDLALMPDRLILTTGFFIQSARGRTHANGAPTDATDYPEIEDTLWGVSSSLRYQYDERLSFVARYRYENYDQKDWQFDELGVTRLTSSVEGQPLLGTNNDVFLNDGLEDYRAHILSLSAVFQF